jgi:pimeloyl-ACP methyl ester carboxylesterase
MASAYYDVKEGRLYCTADGTGTPVVLLHGFGLDQRMWEDQVEALAGRFRVIRYDMRGYGRSSLPTSQPYAHADDLFLLLSQLNARPAHLVGLSAGGRMAIRFALAYPQAVRSLALVDSALDGYVWSADWQARWNTIDARAKAGDLAEARRLWLEHPLFAPARAQSNVAIRLTEMVQDYSCWHWIHADPGLAAGAPAINRLGEIQARTTVMVGERDLPDFQKIAETLACGIKGAVRLTVPGVGHMVNMEAPQKFNSQLTSFLS